MLGAGTGQRPWTGLGPQGLVVSLGYTVCSFKWNANVFAQLSGLRKSIAEVLSKRNYPGSSVKAMFINLTFQWHGESKWRIS